MDMGIFVVLFFIVVLFMVFWGTFKIVNQGHCGLVTRLGSYVKTLQPGFHILVPFVDKLDRVVDLREQVLPLSPQSVITKDNVNIQVDAVIYYQIMNPYSAIYEINNLVFAIEQLSLTSMRNIVGEMSLDDTLTSREIVNAKLLGIIDHAGNKWGVKTNRVELKDVNPPPEIQRAMNVQMEAERNRRAAVIDAEGQRDAAIQVAEGSKQSKIKAAEAEAKTLELEIGAQARMAKEYIIKLKEAEPDKSALQIIYMDTLKDLSQGPANKIFLPTESITALGGVAAVGEMFKSVDGGKN